MSALFTALSPDLEQCVGHGWCSTYNFEYINELFKTSLLPKSRSWEGNKIGFLLGVCGPISHSPVGKRQRHGKQSASLHL